ncbi:hypothetical protein [Ekhidna sp.]|uniref:hypothetical protein n=1 Tax=Ekhidna sp. TaxID=2608089 RepID=UPI003CCBEA60
MRMFFVVALMFLSLFSCRDSDSVPIPPSEPWMISEFNKRFSIDILSAPIVYNEFTSTYVSTIYKGKALNRIYVSENGAIQSRRIFPLFPLGKQKVMCIIRMSPALMERKLQFIQDWEEAQASINDQHIGFAVENNYDSALVVFDNLNFYLEQDEFPAWSVDRNSVEDFEAFASQNDIDIDQFDILLYMDLDLKNPSGGIGSWEGQFAKVGWFYDDDLVTKERIEGLAFAAYHHEIGHVWGWEHDWSDPYEHHEGFIASPQLFGWKDLDGNGIPEILDYNPN